jgi:hypothetical protein
MKFIDRRAGAYGGYRHGEEPTRPARSGRPDDKLRDEAIHRPFTLKYWIASLAMTI